MMRNVFLFLLSACSVALIGCGQSSSDGVDREFRTQLRVPLPVLLGEECLDLQTNELS